MRNKEQCVAIIAKPGKVELSQLVPQLVNWLRTRHYRVLVDDETNSYFSGCEVVPREELAGSRPAFAIVLGGDGTLLAAARAVSRAQIPILGVNLGSLGFLTEVALAELYPTLEAVHTNRCGVEQRAMLHCQMVRNGECVAEYEALNDVVVNKSTIARIADFDVYVDKTFVSNYKADGLIVSTPTGSTAYSLAAGGPIVAPNVNAFLITPISPHALTHRPLVLQGSASIEIAVKTAPEQAFLTVDGQVGVPLQEGDRVCCSKSQHQVQLLRLQSKTFFEVLRRKLKWGER